MNTESIVVGVNVTLALSFVAVVLGRRLALWRARKQGVYPQSTSIYHGWFSAALTGGCACFGYIVCWLLPLRADVAVILPFIAACIGFVVSINVIRPSFDAKHVTETFTLQLMRLAAGLAVVITVLIVVSLLFETLRFFSSDGVSVTEFFTSTDWAAQTSSAYGVLSLLFGTVFIALIALCVAAPLGFYCAIYLSAYASPATRNIVKPFLEILAGIPTVVYGFFAVLLVSPAMQSLADGLSAGLSMLTGMNIDIPHHPKNTLGAGIVLGVMIIPYISSLTDDVLQAVPQKLKTAAYGAGATTSETLRLVVLPFAYPGIIAAGLLALSRAIGETMIVVMAAGGRASLSLNPFEDVTTITVQIVALLTGDGETDTPKTLSAFALGTVLFGVTLLFNIVAQYVVDRQRQKYAEY